MAKRQIGGSRAIVTGASSGIGRAIALELGCRGAELVLVARRELKLQQLCEQIQSQHQARCTFVAGDIREASIRQAAVDSALQTFGGLDILVNNAGIGALGRFEDAEPQRLREIMEVNFFAPAEMIRAALPALKQGRRPIIVNVGSILGHRGIPRTSEYCASKFAVHGLSESLRAEFARLGIDVLLVSPGTTDTEFDAHRIERRGDEPWPEQKGVSSAAVARATVRAIRLGRHEIVPNARGRLLCWANRVSPRLVDRLMARYG